MARVHNFNTLCRDFRNMTFGSEPDVYFQKIFCFYFFPIWSHVNLNKIKNVSIFKGQSSLDCSLDIWLVGTVWVYRGSLAKNRLTGRPTPDIHANVASHIGDASVSIYNRQDEQ